jgi:hypothetical protein
VLKPVATMDAEITVLKSVNSPKNWIYLQTSTRQSALAILPNGRGSPPWTNFRNWLVREAA